MHIIRTILLTGVALMGHPALAADQLKFGPAPAWVVPQVVPAAPVKGADRPVALLLHDQQVRLEPKAIVSYSELAFKIQKPEGLAAGNLSVGWDPARDTMTINKLEIRRGGQTIDVLKSGQTFTTMRRETNLDVAMLDGQLTANIQPEGLQEGDVVVLATTTEHVDPVLKGHVEAAFAPWGEAQIGLAHARLLWPSSLSLKLQKTGDLPASQQRARDGFNVYELTMRDTEPVIAPKGAPARFRIGRIGEATDFRSWAEPAMLFKPLYAEASTIPASGPLRDEVEKIRKGSSDPKARAEQALQLVQGRIRYVALLMGQGGFVPAAAETTWSRRFGDCKAKTALLLGILHELGISAEPVLVNTVLGDAIGQRLPMAGIFNHVLVRAHVGGKSYWLDGTRTGDTRLDDIEVPDFGWGLPLVADAQLVHLVPAPLQTPIRERLVDIDASSGVLAPASIALTEIYRGDGAVEVSKIYSALSTAQRDEVLRREATEFFGGFQVATSSVLFDKERREYRIVIKGSAKLNWRDGWFYIPTSSIAYTPDFTRPAGPFHDAPLSVSHPNFVKDVATIKLPTGFAAQQTLDPPVHETLVGTEYVRKMTAKADVLTVETSERSIAPEVPYNEALAAASRLKSLSEDPSYLRFTANYRPSEKDVQALAEAEPSSAGEFIERGHQLLNAKKYDQAIADFTKALSLDPTNVTALADRGIAHVWNNNFELAEKDLAAAAALAPENAIVHRARGLKAEKEGDYSAAIDAYSKSLQSDPLSSFAFGHRAYCEYSIGRNDAALSDAERAIKADPSWMDLRVLRANIFFERSDKAAVAREAILLLQENPRSEYAYVAAGKIYARINRKFDAMKAFDAALAIKPLPYIYLNRAQTRPFSDYAARLADLDAALKLDPNDVDTLAEKAEQLAATGQAKEALKLYDRIVQLAPKNEYFAVRRSIILYKAGATSEAEKILAARRSKAKSASELNSLCWTKATAGIMLESAQRDCIDALKLDPESGPTLDSLAFVDLRLGKIDEAINLYSKAIEKKTGSASYMGRSIAYARKGDKPRSDTDRAEALRLDQDAETRFAEFGVKR